MSEKNERLIEAMRKYGMLTNNLAALIMARTSNDEQMETAMRIAYKLHQMMFHMVEEENREEALKNLGEVMEMIPNHGTVAAAWFLVGSVMAHTMSNPEIWEDQDQDQFDDEAMDLPAEDLIINLIEDIRKGLKDDGDKE